MDQEERDALDTTRDELLARASRGEPADIRRTPPANSDGTGAEADTAKRPASST